LPRQRNTGKGKRGWQKQTATSSKGGAALTVEQYVEQTAPRIKVVLNTPIGPGYHHDMIYPDDTLPPLEGRLRLLAQHYADTDFTSGLVEAGVHPLPGASVIMIQGQLVTLATDTSFADNPVAIFQREAAKMAFHLRRLAKAT